MVGTLDPFHSIALAAFVEIAKKQQAWPDSESVKRLAYAMYETDIKVTSAERQSNVNCKDNPD